jgi:hypothetical protein
MKQDLALRRARWQKVSDLLADNKSKITPLADISALTEAWLPGIAEWDRLQAASGTAGAGHLGDAKDAAKTAAADLICRTGRRCSVRAHELGLFSVEDILDRRAYELTHVKDAEARQAMDTMRAALNDNLDAFKAQGLSPEKIADIDAAIKTFVDLMPQPGKSKDAQENYNAQIIALTAKLDGDMGTIIHLLEAEYEDSDPVFVAELLKAAALGRSTGHRSTGIQGGVKRADGTPVTGFKVICSELNKAAMADLNGAYRIPSMRNGPHLYELIDAAGNKVDEAVISMVNGVTVLKDWVVA